MIRVYLLDDEPLAMRRLERMLRSTGRVDIVGMANDPATALGQIAALQPQGLFLDIQMPELNGFEVLARLGEHAPPVIFTTAFDEYALSAFEVNSVDYLLKPVEESKLHRALGRLERVAGGLAPRPDFQLLLEQMKAALQPAREEAGLRIPSRMGDRVHFLDLNTITHFFAEDKLTYAATEEKNWVVDRSITELEQRLDPRRFVRVHRSTLVNLNYVDELFPWFGGRMVLRLRDGRKTEITVARERLKELKERLEL